MKKAFSNLPERIIRLGDNKKIPYVASLTRLPQGFVLLNATLTEKEIIKLYSAECLRIKPSKIIVSGDRYEK